MAEFHGAKERAHDFAPRGRTAMMTCVELALTAQLICLSDHTPVCTDNGSIAQLIGVPACSSTEPSQPNDDLRRFKASAIEPFGGAGHFSGEGLVTSITALLSVP